VILGSQKVDLRGRVSLSLSASHLQIDKMGREPSNACIGVFLGAALGVGFLLKCRKISRGGTENKDSLEGNTFRGGLSEDVVVTEELVPFSIDKCKLNRCQVERYGRQIVLKEFGPEGQIAVNKASVLVIGAGGLGCPAISLLAGAGVGRIGIVDADVVETSNLHRQTLHREAYAGRLKKVDSAKNAIKLLNSDVKCETYDFFFDADNAIELVAEYDIVIEATDSLESKYLANDACVILKKPFICGAAQGLEGQLATYLPEVCCYRCMFPEPPLIDDRGSCSDNGVLGPIPAVIGSMQALQALHLLRSQGSQDRPTIGTHFYMWDGSPQMNMLKMKLPVHNRKKCITCGPTPAISTMKDSKDWCEERSLASSCPRKVLAVPCIRWETVFFHHTDSLMLDVREQVQFRIWAIQGSINIPLKDLHSRLGELRNMISNMLDEDKTLLVLCRRGVDSRTAAKLILDEANLAPNIRVLHVEGGLERLATLRPRYPKY